MIKRKRKKKKRKRLSSSFWKLCLVIESEFLSRKNLSLPHKFFLKLFENIFSRRIETIRNYFLYFFYPRTCFVRSQYIIFRLNSIVEYYKKIYFSIYWSFNTLQIEFTIIYDSIMGKFVPEKGKPKKRTTSFVSRKTRRRKIRTLLVSESWKYDRINQSFRVSVEKSYLFFTVPSGNFQLWQVSKKKRRKEKKNITRQSYPCFNDVPISVFYVHARGNRGAHGWKMARNWHI